MCNVHTWTGDTVRMCLATCFLPSCTLQLCLANWAALQIYRLMFNVQCAMCSPWGTKYKNNLATATSLPLTAQCTLKLRLTQL